MARALAVGILLALAAASPAPAATVTLAVDPDNANFAGIEYRAAAGEANRLAITFTEEFRTIRVADAGATITPSGPQCRSLDANTAECTIAGLPGVQQVLGADVELQDRDDVVESQGPGLTAEGGSGDDVLRFTSVVAGTLNGGGGRDTLQGGRNDDTLIDGDAPGAVDADVLDGRAGNDTVSYATRTERVRVDLADPGPDGQAGEGDVLRSVERVRGGSAADVLAGTSASNLIEGRGGDDRILGRAGEDFIDGGAGDDELAGGDGPDAISGDSGADVMRGGSGSDVFDVRRDGPDAVTCGAGGDTVIAPNRRDLTRRDCEAAAFRFSRGRSIVLDPHPARLTFSLRCPSSEELDGQTIAMSGSIALRGGAGRQLGRGTIPKGPGRRCGSDIDAPLRVLVRVELNARGRRLLSRPTRVIVSLRGTNVPHVRWTSRVRG